MLCDSRGADSLQSRVSSWAAQQLRSLWRQLQLQHDWRMIRPTQLLHSGHMTGACYLCQPRTRALKLIMLLGLEH